MKETPKKDVSISRDLIKVLKIDLETLLKLDKLETKFSIVESQDYSFTEGNTIHIRIYDDYNIPYSYNILLYIAIHELCHVLNIDSTEHDSTFKILFDKYSNLANKHLKYKKPSDLTSYPCHV